MKTTIIVGAGHAGSQCAISLRAEGYTGRIVLVNDDSVVPYHKPPLSKKFLRAEQPEPTPLRAASAYEKANVEWEHQSVQSIDIRSSSITFIDGTQQSYDHLVLALGARNREHPQLKACSNVFSLRTSADALSIHRSISVSKDLVVLGGGFIGLELAACLSDMGRQVTVLEVADRLLGRVVAPEISHKIHTGLAAKGIVVFTQCQDMVFDFSDSQVTGVAMSRQDADGDHCVQTLNCDAMLVGIGAIPNTELANEAGLACENGIAVNACLETSAAGVYAIGDCAQFPHWQTGSNLRLESVQNAVDQAKCVAKTIASGTAVEFNTVPWFWSDIGDMKLQIAGLRDNTPTTHSESVLRESDDATALYHLHDNKVVCVETINSAKDHMLARKLIDQNTAVSRQQIMQGADVLKSLLTV